ncbi:MAG: hypothetical protein ABSC06_12890 [Rhodopila sp.]|jgi:hypothetical protein
MTLIVALLAPMFLGVTAGDVDLARMAAAETINDYRARNHADLIAVVQIIAFGLAALSSLSLSMADEISLAMTLRLRNNANALNRSAEQNRRVLRESVVNELMQHHADTPAKSDPVALFPDHPASLFHDEPDGFLSPAAEQLLAAEAQARLRDPEENIPAAPSPSSDERPAPPAASDKRHREMWAIALVKEAGDITAAIPHLPSAERHAAKIRAAEMTRTAHDLLYGYPVPQLDPAALAGIARSGAPE